MSFKIAERRLHRSKSVNYVELLKKNLISATSQNISGFLSVRLFNGLKSRIMKTSPILSMCTLIGKVFSSYDNQKMEEVWKCDLKFLKTLKLYEDGQHVKKKLTQKFNKVVEFKCHKQKKVIQVNFGSEENMNFWLSTMFRNLNAEKEICVKWKSSENTKSENPIISYFKQIHMFPGKKKRLVAKQNVNKDENLIVTESAKKFFSVRTQLSPFIFRGGGESPDLELIDSEVVDVQSGHGNLASSKSESKSPKSLKTANEIEESSAESSSSTKFTAPLYPLPFTKRSSEKLKKRFSRKSKKNVVGSSSEGNPTVDQQQDLVVCLEGNPTVTQPQNSCDQSSHSDREPISTSSSSSLTKEFTEYLNTMFDRKSEPFLVLNEDSWKVLTLSEAHKSNEGDDSANFQSTCESLAVSPCSPQSGDSCDVVNNLKHYVPSEESASNFFPLECYTNFSTKSSYRQISLEEIKEKEKVLELKKRLSFPNESFSPQQSSHGQHVHCLNKNHDRGDITFELPVIHCALCRTSF